MSNSKVTSLIFAIAIFLSGLFSFQSQGQISPADIVRQMSASIEKINSLKFKMKKKERVNGKILTGEQDVKFVRNPKKIYTKVIAPNKGVEVLYVEGKNKNYAYVNPNAFPYITLSLDPYGSIMRKNNHHTVHEVGFDYINDIVTHIKEKSGSNFDKYFKYIGDTVFNNRKCFKLLIDYIPFAYVDYTVKPGEDLKDIAYKLFVSDYMILSINKDIDDYDDVEAGQVIKVPNAYSRKTYLYIDQQTFLPIVQIMYDDKGLFAQYEFYDLEINPVIPDEEFSKDYKGYDF